MARYDKPAFTEEDLGFNPFLTNLKISIVPFRGNSYKKEGDKFVPVVVELERQSYAKLFTDSKRRLRMNKLSLRAKELLLWILHEVETNADHMWLNKKMYMTESGISSIDTYKAAVKDLIMMGFICRTVIQDVYWINPGEFFKGSRVARFPENVVSFYSSKHSENGDKES